AVARAGGDRPAQEEGHRAARCVRSLVAYYRGRVVDSGTGEQRTFARDLSGQGRHVLLVDVDAHYLVAGRQGDCRGLAAGRGRTPGARQILKRETGRIDPLCHGVHACLEEWVVDGVTCAVTTSAVSGVIQAEAAIVLDTSAAVAWTFHAALLDAVHSTRRFS